MSECENTDREIWRGPDEGNGSYYADSIHITKEGAIGINCGGHVIVKPLREWFSSVNKEQEDAIYAAYLGICDLHYARAPHLRHNE